MVFVKKISRKIFCIGIGFCGKYNYSSVYVMLLSSVLFEARRNASLNPKVSINSVIRREYESAEKLPIGIKNSFVSFTRIEKLGINPMSRFNTPLGIYCYPSEYVLSKTSTNNGDVLSMSSLPFAGNQPYGNIFSVSGNIIRIDNMDNFQYWEYLSELKKVLETKYSDIDGIIENYEQLINDSPFEAKFGKLFGGRFWYIIMGVANVIGGARGIKGSVMWNKLFRDIGIDGVVDMGSGIIHTAEPTQAVFFKIENISNVVTQVHNKYSKSAMDAKVRYGKGNLDSISSLKTQDEDEKIRSVIDNPFLINYVNRAIRDECLNIRPYLLHDLKNITNDDILAALDGSHLTIILSLFNNTEFKPNKSEYKDPVEYQTTLKSWNKIQLIKRQLKTIPEQDILHLINKWLTDKNNQTAMCMALLNYFPRQDRIFDLLWQKFPKNIFAASGQIPLYYSDLLHEKIQELGKKDPDGELYAFFKR